MQKRYLWLAAGVLAAGLGVPRAGHAAVLATGDTFKHIDVGSPSEPGSTKVEGTGAAAKLTVTGTGNDVWAGTEQMQFAYTTLPGDGGVTARLLSVSGGDDDGWSKTGTMLRESDAADGPHIAAYLAYCNVGPPDQTGNLQQGRNVEPSFRINANNDMERAVGNISFSDHFLDSHEYYRRLAADWPLWMRTQRQGSLYQHLVSDDGKVWFLLSQDTLAIDAKKAIVAGVYSTEHKDMSTTPYVGVYDNVVVDDAVIPTGPAGVQALPGTGAVLVTYNGVANAVGYNVYRQASTDKTPVKVGNMVPNGWFIDDQGITNGTQYRYMVTAVFKGGTESSATTQALAQPNVPIGPGLMSYDIGTQNAGTTTLNGTTLTITGSGVDIWNAVDGFRYVAMPMAGDYSITAKLLEKPAQGTGNVEGWVKAGVMIREDLGPGARNAATVASSGNGIAFHWRRGGHLDNGQTQGDNPSEAEASGTDDATTTYPVYLRVTRTGDTVQGFQSKDGTTFTKIGDDINIPVFSRYTYAGLCVTGHHERLYGIAKFDLSSLTIK